MGSTKGIGLNDRIFRSGEDHIARELRRQIESHLYRLGLLCRVFVRVKSDQSLRSKLDRNGGAYYVNGRKIQDLFGVRIVLYFSDDSDIAQSIIRSAYSFDSASVSESTNDIFGPVRCNLVFRVPLELLEFSEMMKNHSAIDSTFEVQFRTVLSEGWHEVEHDLRYKRSNEWAHQDDLNRALNGIMATLENCDWSMMKIFDEMAWRHYRSGNTRAMIQSKFRLKFDGDDEQHEALWDLFDQNHELSKKLFRVNRNELLCEMLNIKGVIPITFSNIVHLCNRFFINDGSIKRLEPILVSEVLDRHLA